LTAGFALRRDFDPKNRKSDIVRDRNSQETNCWFLTGGPRQPGIDSFPRGSRCGITRRITLGRSGLGLPAHRKQLVAFGMNAVVPHAIVVVWDGISHAFMFTSFSHPGHLASTSMKQT
jgi:hypothetical protein